CRKAWVWSKNNFKPRRGDRIRSIINALDRQKPPVDSRVAAAGGGITRAGTAALPEVCLHAGHRFDDWRVPAFRLCLGASLAGRTGRAEGVLQFLLAAIRSR